LNMKIKHLNGAYFRAIINNKMEERILYDKIRDICEYELGEYTSWEDNLFQKGFIVTAQYCAEGGEQQKAYDTLLRLHNFYIGKESDESKLNYIDDLLDCVSGFVGNDNYKIWDKHL